MTAAVVGEDRSSLRLMAGRVRAAELMPYFTTALFAMIPVRSEDVPTAATDTRWRLYWNPRFIERLSINEVAAVWLHEVQHVVLDHAGRFAALLEPQHRQPLFNCAADAAINAALRQSRITMPGKAWYPEHIPGAEDGMSTEQMYRLLVDNHPRVSLTRSNNSDQSDPKASGTRTGSDTAAGEEQTDCGSGAGGVRRPWELGDSDDDGSVDAGRAHLIREQVARAIRDHSRYGTAPGSLQRWAKQLLSPEVDWRAEFASILRRIIGAIRGSMDFSYSRPSRRQAASPNVVLPGMVQPPPPRIEAILDTSGSIDEVMLGRCLTEVDAILRRLRLTMQVTCCDADVRNVQKLTNIHKVELIGGGGTDMRVALQAAAARRPANQIIITFTDGGTPWPETPPAENRKAHYITVLVAGEPQHPVPEWMHKIVLNPSYLEEVAAQRGR